MSATLALMLAPLPALAEVCDKVRPLWEPGAPATGWDELLGLMATPPSLALLILSAAAIRFGHQWLVLTAVVGWSIWVSFVAMSAPDAIRQQAIAEGCIGSPVLFIIVVAAICGGMILYTSRRAKRPN
ncbi:hypothetical protein [Ovoidimarina sediminis]|uniref:hypothetical protein n=1 Tax=Ovoidimarina sediminis TaxID=3079856 RepID=UPI00290F6A06|nr:hypothetical protein [Rhodophyticola sp. MJ-SS7]MDU8944421.1 hypothetical protein [Rhodophyticola sp. MJ-SS7]